MMRNLIGALLLLTIAAGCVNQNDEKEYFTLVTYNAENVFDADGIAVFNDYKPTDRNGDPQYTSEDVYTKIDHIIEVMKQYEEGEGPDVIAMVEVESDFSPAEERSEFAAAQFLEDWQNTTLEEMLGENFDEEIADIPSELLILKGLYDSGMTGYKIHVGYSEMNEEGEPQNVQKNVLFSRFPILRDSSRTHTVERARPILESWLDVRGHTLIVFTNHWKSGAGSAEMETIRKQNAGVLRNRIDQLRKRNPYVDMVVAGDLNSHYDQLRRNSFLESAIEEVLGSTGNEVDLVRGDTTKLYNLWYEIPPNERRSDSYRGEWGTLMHILISGGMYDIRGVHYVDNSFSVGDFGFNTYSTSGEPRRWSSEFSGSGYSDHLPISMTFSYGTRSELREAKGLKIVDPSTTDRPPEEGWGVQYALPDDYLDMETFSEGNPRENPELYDRYFYLQAEISNDQDLIIDDFEYDVYGPSFNADSLLEEISRESERVQFYGRLSKYRGTWQFIIEDPSFIEPIR